MNYPSVKTIESKLDLDRETAKKIRGLMDGSIDPETVEHTEQWVRQCYNRPSEDELIMDAIDSVLFNCGVESLGDDLGSFYRYAPQYSLSNAGDTYATTVILNNETGRFSIGSWGDLVESGKVRIES